MCHILPAPDEQGGSDDLSHLDRGGRARADGADAGGNLGRARLPFPPVGKGSWVAMAGDARNSTIEVYPRGTELHETPGDMEGEVRIGTGRRNGPFHAAVATPL